MRLRLLNTACSILSLLLVAAAANAERPNILLCISDDQSYAHTGANGDPVVNTPGFDRIAREGLRFIHAFCDAPTCGPSRSAILTGQPIWRLEEAGNIHSTFPSKFQSYTELLQRAGYFVGHTGKGWSPGRLEPGGRSINPAGPEFKGQVFEPSHPGLQVSRQDYAANFENFLSQVPDGSPFCFWLGTYEPHRGYQKGSGVRRGKALSDVVVPPIFPDNDIVRSDILDYLVEIEHFDQMVVRALALLEATGQLDNTLVIVTSDHGMPFPRAKASLYDAGSRVPLAIRWPQGIEGHGRSVDSFVNLSALAPTILEAAGLTPPEMMTAPSMLELFQVSISQATRSPGTSARADAGLDAAYLAMERHDGCREGGKGYPCRAVRTKEYLYIYNFEPSRWPAGSPDRDVCARRLPFGEVDSSPTKTFMMEQRNVHTVARLSELAFGMRPREELYELSSDPHQMNNLAGERTMHEIQQTLHKRLFEHLQATADPRVIGGRVDWDYYPYYGRIHPETTGWSVAPRPE